MGVHLYKNRICFADRLLTPSVCISVSLVLLSSLLQVLSFPVYDQGWLAWLALIPLILSIRNCRVVASSMLGLLCGTLTAFGIFHWIFQVPGFQWYHFVILGCYLGLYPALWCGGASILGNRRYLAMITVPALWCTLDYVKAHAGFLAFPWAVLAHSQHNNLSLIQLAAYTGEYGVTFLVVMVNYAIVMTFVHKNWPAVIVPATILILVHLWGHLALPAGDSAAPKVEVAVVQPNILRNQRQTIEDFDESFDHLASLTLGLTRTRPTVVVWPETAVKNLETNTALLERIRSVAKTVDAPIITGSSEVLKFAERSEQQSGVQFNNRVHNSAYFISPDGTLMEPYRKIRLVPFSEYTPGISFIQWPDWLVSDSFNISPGDSFKHFPLGEGYRVSPIICWENIFSDHIVALVGEGSDLIVQLTNNNRFGQTAAPYQHNAASVFRAVENKVPIVIASNTGPSQIIDSFGRIVAEVPYLSDEGATTASLSVGRDDTETFYTENGDLFVRICVVLALIAIIDSSLAYYKSLLRVRLEEKI